MHTRTHTHTSSDVRDVVNERILTTQVEERVRWEHLKAVDERRILAEQHIKCLETELSKAEQQRSQEVSIDHGFITLNAHFRWL